MNINGYEDLQDALSDVIKENNLDIVSVHSLLMSSFDFLEPELQSASVAIINFEELNKSKSIHPSNIQVNMKVALDAIFAVKSIFSAEDFSLVLLVLKAILTLINCSTVQINKEEAIVLFSVYRLKNSNVDGIYDYIKRLKEENENISVINREAIEQSLRSLEKIKAIELVDGLYSVRDIIILKAS